MSLIKSILASLLVLGLLQVSGSYAFQTESQTSLQQGLFDSEDVLDIRLEGDIETLLDDRGDDPSYHVLKLHFQNGNQMEESQDLRVRVRGNFRRLRKNCDTPPLKFDFEDHVVPENSLFAGHPELKLVVPCKGEEYVIREYLTYKLYNLFTDYSFRVRMVRFSLNDTVNDEMSEPQFGFLIEDKEVLASRLNAALMERTGMRPEIINQEDFFRMSVFAFMIGNTDWSIQYLHNIEMLFLNDERVYVAVPYDFDLVGLVSSPYARPSPALKLRSVRERVYRGYCLEDLSVLDATFDRFRELRPEIYKTITENALLEERSIEFATEYLDDFYNILSSDRRISREFSYPCNSYGTGNVVISGMQDG
jgi:hypothetical protein